MALDFSKSKNNTLLNTFKKSEETNTKVIRELPIEQLVETETNEYIFGISDLDVERLSEEIRDHGFSGSISVMDLENGKYQIISGHQRFRAVKKLGWKTIPCMVSPRMSTENQYRELIASNVLSRKITPLGYARAIEAFKTEVIDKDPTITGRKRTYIAHFFGIAEGQVIRYETITKMPAEIQEMCKNPDFPYSALEGSSGFTDEEKQELLNKINNYNKMNEGTDAKLSANTLRQFVESIKKKAEFKENQAHQLELEEAARKEREEELKRMQNEESVEETDTDSVNDLDVEQETSSEDESTPFISESTPASASAIEHASNDIPAPSVSAPFTQMPMPAFTDNKSDETKPLSIDRLIERTERDLSGLADADIIADDLESVKKTLAKCMESLNEIKAKLES